MVLPTTYQKSRDFQMAFDRCARCGSRHEGLVFHKLTNPPKFGDEMITHSATCPVTNLPVLLTVSETHQPSCGCSHCASEQREL